MTSRISTVLQRLTDMSATSWWRPQAFGPPLALDPPAPTTEDRDEPIRDGSSDDLRGRQRDLAFELYGEALMRTADDDARRHRRARRKTA